MNVSKASESRLIHINGVQAIEAQLTIRPGAFNYARSAIGKHPSSKEFSWLMGILEGHKVAARAFPGGNGTNVSGVTNEAQLREAFRTRDESCRLWINEPQLEAVIEKFGDGKLAFHMGGMYCQETPAEIENLIAAALSRPVELDSFDSTTELTVQVVVVGEASCADDEDANGVYDHFLLLSRPVDLNALTKQEASAIATAALDSFHDHQGIEVLDDFHILVQLPDGRELEELSFDEPQEADLVRLVSHEGKIADINDSVRLKESARR